MEIQPAHPIKIFYCYAHEDNALREQLARHLSPLRRLRDITGWSDRDIQAGSEWEQESKEHLESADIILLLISADFIASDYCYSIEMEQAIERHKAGTAWVIPILLRPVEWEKTPLGELSPLPTDRRPITQWVDQDTAWLNVIQGISEIIRKFLPRESLSVQDADILYSTRGSLSGQTIGNQYLLGELIGEGGFSQVYKSQHLHIQRQQAIKVLLEQYFRKQEFQDRFLREAQILASLDHPNIIHIDEFWVETPRAYLVMPFISGGSLQDVLEKQQGLLERDRIVSYLEDICAGLDYAHKGEIAHLDLKPSNILVHESGKLLLSDFGLAHIMMQGAIKGGSSLRIGTPDYMAPEHIKGAPEKLSDLFSLGIILYQMLLGQLPSGSLHPETISAKNQNRRLPTLQSLRPELPQEVENVLKKALAKQQKHRYQTADELLAAFKNALVPSPQIIIHQYPLFSDTIGIPNIALISLYKPTNPLLSINSQLIPDYPLLQKIHAERVHNLLRRMPIDAGPTLNITSTKERWLSHHRAGRFNDALAAYDQALLLQPSDPNLWNSHATVLHELQRYNEEISCYDYALKLDPNNAFALISRAMTLVELGHLSEALQDLDKVLTVYPNLVVAWQVLHDILFTLSRLDEALIAIEKALELDPGNTDFLNRQGNVLRRQKKPEAALEAHKRATQLAPNNAIFWFDLANDFRELRLYTEALANYKRALDLEPALGGAWYNQGNVLAALHRYEEAVDSYSRALNCDSGLVSAWYNKASVLHELGRDQEALMNLDSALALAPDYVAAWNNKGVFLAELGRLEEALIAFDQASTRAPKEADPWYNKAAILSRLGRQGEAIASQEWAQSLNLSESG